MRYRAAEPRPEMNHCCLRGSGRLPSGYGSCKAGKNVHVSIRSKDESGKKTLAVLAAGFALTLAASAQAATLPAVFTAEGMVHEAQYVDRCHRHGHHHGHVHGNPTVAISIAPAMGITSTAKCIVPAPLPPPRPCACNPHRTHLDLQIARRSRALPGLGVDHRLRQTKTAVPHLVVGQRERRIVLRGGAISAGATPSALRLHARSRLRAVTGELR